MPSSQTRPLFSVIVPVYNAAGTLPALCASLFDQIGKDCEVIFVDDASPDNSAEIAARYPARLIRCSTNQGPAVCRNAGARAAQGEILVFTDSDCRVHSGWLDAIRNAFADRPREAVMGRVRGTTAGLVLTLLVSAALLAGCSPSETATVQSMDPAAAQAACFANQQTFETEVLVYLSNNPDTRMRLDYRSLLSAGIAQTEPECPAGGDLVWEPTSATLNCSIHGHWDS